MCRLEFSQVNDARAIVALPALLKGSLPFAALGALVDGEGEEPLIMAPAARMEITVGDIQEIAEARARAFPPVEDAQPRQKLRRKSSRRHRPKGFKY